MFMALMKALSMSHVNIFVDNLCVCVCVLFVCVVITGLCRDVLNL